MKNLDTRLRLSPVHINRKVTIGLHRSQMEFGKSHIEFLQFITADLLQVLLLLFFSG